MRNKESHGGVVVHELHGIDKDPIVHVTTILNVSVRVWRIAFFFIYKFIMMSAYWA